MLNDAEDKIIETIIREQGLAEENILAGLTEQQLKCWVRYSILGQSRKDILHSLFAGRKNASESTVEYVITEAQIRIILNSVKDYDLLMDGGISPRVKANIQALLDKLEEMRKQKGAKRLCPSNRSR